MCKWAFNLFKKLEIASFEQKNARAHSLNPFHAPENKYTDTLTLKIPILKFILIRLKR